MTLDVLNILPYVVPICGMGALPPAMASILYLEGITKH